MANNISHTLSRHEADAEDQTFLCPNISLNDTETLPTLIHDIYERYGAVKVYDEYLEE